MNTDIPQLDMIQLCQSFTLTYLHYLGPILLAPILLEKISFPLNLGTYLASHAYRLRQMTNQSRGNCFGVTS